MLIRSETNKAYFLRIQKFRVIILELDFFLKI